MKALVSKTGKRTEHDMTEIVEPEWPAWLTGEEMKELPPRAQRAVKELLVPVYKEMVLEAGTGLERAAAEPFLYLFWLELLRQFRLSGELAKAPGFLRLEGDINPEREIDRYLEFLKEKLKLGRFLLHAKVARQRCRGETGAAALPPSGSGGTIRGLTPPARHVLRPEDLPVSQSVQSQ
jgi:hypothetical protein